MTANPEFEVEWDPGKARSNLTKHGVSFEEAAGTLLDPHSVSLIDEKHAPHEERWVTLGEARTGRLLVTVHTFEKLSGGRYGVRIISARKATKRERRAYEERS